MLEAARNEARSELIANFERYDKLTRVKLKQKYKGD
jgi:hypothetical protein